MRWTNNKRHYITAKHPDPDTADLTGGDVLGALALVVLVAVTFAACALWVAA